MSPASFPPLVKAPFEQQLPELLAAACMASWHDFWGLVQVEPALTSPTTGRRATTVLMKVVETILKVECENGKRGKKGVGNRTKSERLALVPFIPLAYLINVPIFLIFWNVFSRATQKEQSKEERDL